MHKIIKSMAQKLTSCFQMQVKRLLLSLSPLLQASWPEKLQLHMTYKSKKSTKFNIIIVTIGISLLSFQVKSRALYALKKEIQL